MADQDAGARILIVDDNTKNIQVLGTMLREEGYQLNVAQNGVAALKVVDTVLPDLILLDVNMPEMDGRELTTRIFAMADDAPTPDVVVVTTEASNPRINELIAKGVKGYVHKPFTPEAIREVLNDVGTAGAV